MKISFIAENDWANVLTEYSHCLNKHSEDIECKSICFRPHPFNYSIQHDYDLENCIDEILERARKWVDESDVIIFGEEGHPLENKYRTIREFDALLGLDLINSNKKLCIWHPGTHYRQNYEFYNNHPLRDKIYKHFYALDLYHLSLKYDNDIPLWPYQYFNFNKENYINNFNKKIKIKPWVILHIPSNSNTKGTKEIVQIINNLKLDHTKYIFKYLNKIPNKEVIKEKEKSLFYIDQFNPNVGGYGIASLEGLFTSNLTFSTVNNIGLSIQKLTNINEIGVIPLGDNFETLSNTLEYFLTQTSDEELIKYNEAIGEWIERHYSPQNITEFFKSILK